MRNRIVVTTVAMWLAVAAGVRAELPTPRLDRLSVLGGNAGTSLELTVTGNDLDDLQAIVFDHPGLHGELVSGKQNTFQVTIDSSVPEGTYDVWLLGKWGVTNPRLFAVSHQLTDVTEKEPNNDAATAQVLAVNSAVNGQCENNDQDVYRVTLRRQETVLVDCQASRLEVQIDPVVLIRTPDGKQLASSSNDFGRDASVSYTADEDGEYLVVVHDLSYRGGLPYRLLVSNRPHVERVTPRAVRWGEPTELTAYGHNLGAGPADVESVRFPLVVPSDAALGRFTFLEHPTAFSVAPTAATFTVSGFQIRPELPSPAIHAQTLLVVDSPVEAEREPNPAAEQAQVLKVPTAVCGQFDQPRDADWYEITVAEKGQYAIDVYCERIAGQADPYVALLDEAGNRLQELDDFGPRINAFDAYLRDPYAVLELNAGQKYRMLVQDRYGRGGPRCQYVLVVRRPQPDFSVAAIHRQNPGPAGATLLSGGAMNLELIVHRQDNFSGPITVTAEDLPPGVHAQPTTITQHNQGSLVLWADADAPVWDGAIRLTATGTHGEEKLVRDVRTYTRVWPDNPSSSRPVRRQRLSVRPGAPFRLEFGRPVAASSSKKDASGQTAGHVASQDAGPSAGQGGNPGERDGGSQGGSEAASANGADGENRVQEAGAGRIEVVAGQKIDIPLKLTRLDSAVTGQVTIQPFAFPGSINVQPATIGSSATETMVTLEVQAGTQPGDYTLTVLGQAQVPFARSADQPKSDTLVTLPSLPLCLTVLPR